MPLPMATWAEGTESEDQWCFSVTGYTRVMVAVACLAGHQPTMR